jgi:hypothetical protein
VTTASFDATVIGEPTKTGIEVPPSVIEALGAGKRPAVEVELNGYRFRTSVGVMGGKHLVPVNADTRKQAGVGAGDAVHVTLTVATAPRTVGVPADLAAALAAEPAAAAFFAGLSNSLQRMHVDNVNGAKSADTRQRRVEKCIALFVAGKQR